MTLAGAILKQVRSVDSYPSPPPETELVKKKKRKSHSHPYNYVKCKVDTSPPIYDATSLPLKLPGYRNNVINIVSENIKLLMAIKNAHFSRGKVDSRWTHPPSHTKVYYENRVNFLNQVQRFNQVIHARLMKAKPRVDSTASLERDWRRNRKEILDNAQAKFVLFPPIFVEDIEDLAFKAAEGVKRPRVYMRLNFVDGMSLGVLRLELFTDICPETCKLFMELMEGDATGYGYVGTQFFRKVPNLFWSGGDVIHNNGFGCYAQRGRAVPIGAENYHFSHSIQGLLSMRMTRDDEMCGIFNITFKPLPQFDLKNVVFGRVIRPCHIYESIKQIGSALSTQPVVEISELKRRSGKQWIYGVRNTKKITTSRS